MKDYGENPGGNKKLRHLLYPFYKYYPIKVWSRYRWWRLSKLSSSLSYINRRKKWLTVIDRLGAPGDSLITANVIRCIKSKYPKIKINCITPYPELIKLDPCVSSINSKETFYSFDSSYWELIVGKEKNLNVVKHSLNRLNIFDFEYKAKYYLDPDESAWAENLIDDLGSTKPILAICTKSKEDVKNWPEAYWEVLVEKLVEAFSIIHLGDEREPHFHQVRRFAGLCTIRESAALLSKAEFFLGPDSLLMHIANGLDIPSVIIFGGSRPVGCFGYFDNINLGSNPPCSPCWIHSGYEVCSKQLKCLHSITVMDVFSSIIRLTNKQ